MCKNSLIAQLSGSFPRPMRGEIDKDRGRKGIDLQPSQGSEKRRYTRLLYPRALFLRAFSTIINRIVVTACNYKLSLCDLARALRVYRRNDLTRPLGI